MAIPSKGAIITGTTANNTTALPVGTDGQVLTANSACAQGLEWTSPFGEWTCATETAVQIGSSTNYLIKGAAAGDEPNLTFAPDGNCVIYRQTGPKTYQVLWVLKKTVSDPSANSGSGQYYYELPAALPNIDTSVFNQTAFTGCTTCTNTNAEFFQFVCSGLALGNTALRFGSSTAIAIDPGASVYNNRCFRFIFAPTPTNNCARWHGSGNYCFAGDACSFWCVGVEYQSV
jgi:hypothetical protein